jgi:hypothetical protein
MTYNRTMRAAFIRFLRFLAWIELASVPVIYWTRGYLVWVFGPAGMTAVWWFCGFTVACALVVLVRFRVRRPAENPAARPQGDMRGELPRMEGRDWPLAAIQLPGDHGSPS